MKPNANPILIGIIAGLVAAIGTAGSMVMPFFAQLVGMTALFMAGLGFGRVGFGRGGRIGERQQEQKQRRRHPTCSYGQATLTP